MENFSGLGKEDDQMELPPGFRFLPTDEELITHYLSKKVFDSNFSSRAIGEVDLNKVEPWDLPGKAKMGEKEWYFFCVRDKKYPFGLRINRATAAGYWKSTGKDKEIFRGKALVGMKKTLVFFEGRTPKGEKTNWVMHEYRLEGEFSLQYLPKTAENERVICRVFQKSSGGKKIPSSGLVRLSSVGNELGPVLPPFMDSSPYAGSAKLAVSGSVRVSCFPNQVDIPRNQQEMTDYINNPLFASLLNPTDNFPRISLPNSFYPIQGPQIQGSLQHPGSISIQDQAFRMGFLESYGPNLKQGLQTENDTNTEISSVGSNLEMGRRQFGVEEASPASAGQMEIGYLWNY